jgi:hypothetical protein
LLANDVAANTNGADQGAPGQGGGNFLNGGGGVVDLASSGNQGSIVNGGDTSGGEGGGGEAGGGGGHGAIHFVPRGGFTGFSDTPVPPTIQLRLTASLSSDVRDELSNATNGGSGDSSGGSSTGVTDQDGKPAKGFSIKPGGAAGFDGSTPPPRIQKLLTAILSAETRAELDHAKK